MIDDSIGEGVEGPSSAPLLQCITRFPTTCSFVQCRYHYQRYQRENTEINGRTVDPRNIDISTAPLIFCMVVEQFFKTVNLVKINCQEVDIATRILEMWRLAC